LVTYLEQYFTSDVVAVGGRVKPLPGTRNTVLPSSAHHGDYLALIQSLPDADTPALFSLPPNIDRAAQQVRLHSASPKTLPSVHYVVLLDSQYVPIIANAPIFCGCALYIIFQIVSSAFYWARLITVGETIWLFEIE
jgi:hypothetical protein